ncbi:hypothetical protein TNCT_288871, partial [Trichonephila clavata]
MPHLTKQHRNVIERFSCSQTSSQKSVRQILKSRGTRQPPLTVINSTWNSEGQTNGWMAWRKYRCQQSFNCATALAQPLAAGEHGDEPIARNRTGRFLLVRFAVNIPPGQQLRAFSVTGKIRRNTGMRLCINITATAATAGFLVERRGMELARHGEPCCHQVKGVEGEGPSRVCRNGL